MGTVAADTTDRAGRADRIAGHLERACAGDREALGEVVRELNPLLWHVARSQGLTVDEARKKDAR